MTAPSFLARSMPTFWASWLELDQPYSKGFLAFLRILCGFRYGLVQGGILVIHPGYGPLVEESTEVAKALAAEVTGLAHPSQVFKVGEFLTWWRHPVQTTLMSSSLQPTRTFYGLARQVTDTDIHSILLGPNLRHSLGFRALHYAVLHL